MGQIEEARSARHEALPGSRFWFRRGSILSRRLLCSAQVASRDIMDRERSALPRAVWVRCDGCGCHSWSLLLSEEGFMKPNKPDAANPAVASQLHVERHWRRVADLER